MKKNGFTFIEMLGVITVLVLISIIVLVVVDKSLKDSKKTLYNAQLGNIRSSARMWMADNIELIPDEGYYTVTLEFLQDNGYIGNEIRSLIDDSVYDKNMVIQIGMNDILLGDETGFESIEDYMFSNANKQIEIIKNQNLNLTGLYQIGSDGQISNGTDVYNFDFIDNKPSGGFLTYNDSGLDRGCIAFDKYKVTIENGELQSVEKGGCNFGGEVITNIPVNGHTGVKAIVYLDPTDITAECNEVLAAGNINSNGSKTGIKSGCMKWYAYEEDDTTYTMILDHNTTAKVAWITKDDYEQTGSQTVTPENVGIEYLNGLPNGIWHTSLGTNNRGPITLLNQLKKDTSSWVDVETLTEIDKYTVEWNSSSDYYSGDQEYTINYAGYNARLISAEEINNVLGKKSDMVSDVQVVYFDNRCTTNGTCDIGTNKYGWLFDYTGVAVSAGTIGEPDCIQYGCNVGYNFDSYYWTVSPNANIHSNAWYVKYNGMIDNNDVDDTSHFGLRPVIKISKLKLFQ